MATSKKYPKQFHVECLEETLANFERAMKRHGFKTKTEAFAAFAYTFANVEILDPQQQNRMEAILLRLLEWHEGPA